MTGYLLLAAFMAVVVVGAGMPTGLFARAAHTSHSVSAAPEEGTHV